MKGPNNISWLLLITLSLLFHGMLNAQCNEGLEADIGSRGYQIRNNRCEGFYVSQVSSGSLDIVGITQGKFKFKNDPNEKLTISVPIEKDETINIRAVGIPSKTYYRMDAQISGSESFEWPIGDVIFKGGLTDKKIGVFGWTGSEKEKIYVPIKATSKMIAASDGNTVYIYLRTAIDVKNVKWRFANISEDDNCAKASGWENPQKTSYKSGDRIVCKIPAAYKDNLCVEVRADAQQGGDKLSRRAKIILK